MIYLKIEGISEPISEPISTLAALVGKYSMATVLGHLSIFAGMTGEHITTDDDWQGRDLKRLQAHCERVRFDLRLIADYAREFMNDEEGSTDD
jgi:hypothetical protein